MNRSYRTVVFTLFLAFFALGPILSYAQESTDPVRYLVKTNSSFWKKTLNVHNTFDKGFTSDLSDIQLGLLKIFGVEAEPIKVLQILPTTKESMNVPVSTGTVIKTKKSSRIIPSDPTPWGIETIYNDTAIAKTSGGEGVSVAILDTGVTTTHPDLKNRITACKDFTSIRASVVDNECTDHNGHGTHVAGIVAGDSGSDGMGIYGVAPSASVMAYKVCNDRGTCYADDIAQGIVNATDKGAQIINMSFGSENPSGLIEDAITYANAKGVLLVAAGGNDGPFDDSIDYPGASPLVIAVGAINNKLESPDWSSRGINEKSTAYVVEAHDIEFAAPGEGIESTSKSGGYVVLSGTSMASPFVAGMAAKYWQADAKNPAQATRDMLHTLAKDIVKEGDDNASGFGLPQVK